MTDKTKSKRKEPLAASPKPEAADRRRHLLAVLALVLLALVAYWDSFGTGLPYDNGFIILDDARITAATRENLRLILTQDYWYTQFSSALYRPLVTLSYLFNWAILGNGAAPFGYHAFNVAIHTINVLLVYALAMVLLGEMPLALATAAIWCVHPVLTESVTNVVGRADLLAGFGVIAGLLCYIRGAAAGGLRRIAWLMGLILACAVGMFSKESGIVLLAAMAIYDVTFPKWAGWRTRIVGYLAAAAPVLLYLTARSRVLARVPSGLVPFTENPLVGADFWTTRLTAIKVIGKYLWLLLWPVRLSFDYSYNQVPLFNWRLDSVEDWKALVAVAVCACTAALAIVSYRRRKPVFFLLPSFSPAWRLRRTL